MNVIRMDLGEVASPPPPEAIIAATRAALANRARYMSPAGLPELRVALAAWLQTAMRPVQPDEVVITTGASGALMSVLMHLRRDGGHVLIPDPGYPAYRRMAELIGLQTRRYTLRANQDWTPDLVQLRTQLRDEPCALLLTNPSNPTGAVMDADTLRAVLQLTAEVNVPVIADEAYADLYYGTPPTNARQIAPAQVYTVLSFSKTFALSGWRIGAVLAPPDQAAAVASAHFATLMSAPAPAQYALLACLSVADTYLPNLRVRLTVARDQAIALLKTTPLRCNVPDAGLFCWAATGLPDEQPLVEALRHAGVLLSPGQAFGPSGAGYVRVMFDVEPSTLHEAVRRLMGVFASSAGVPT